MMTSETKKGSFIKKTSLCNKAKALAFEEELEERKQKKEERKNNMKKITTIIVILTSLFITSNTVYAGLAGVLEGSSVNETDSTIKKIYKNCKMGYMLESTSFIYGAHDGFGYLTCENFGPILRVKLTGESIGLQAGYIYEEGCMSIENIVIENRAGWVGWEKQIVSFKGSLNVGAGVTISKNSIFDETPSPSEVDFSKEFDVNEGVDIHISGGIGAGIYRSITSL